MFHYMSQVKITPDFAMSALHCEEFVQFKLYVAYFRPSYAMNDPKKRCLRPLPHPPSPPIGSGRWRREPVAVLSLSGEARSRDGGAFEARGAPPQRSHRGCWYMLLIHSSYRYFGTIVSVFFARSSVYPLVTRGSRALL